MDKPLRKSDGSLEHRTPDELLQQAGEEASRSRLPGHGKPIDFGRYFDSGDMRAAHKLLADNAVLPLPLQHLKDAETALDSAKNLPRDRAERLDALLAEIRSLVERAAEHLGTNDFLRRVGWAEIPAAARPGLLDQAEPTSPIPDPGDDAVTLLADRLDRYTRIRRYLLEVHQAAVQEARDGLAAYARTQSLTQGTHRAPPSIRKIDVDEAEAAFHNRFPDLPPLTTDSHAGTVVPPRSGGLRSFIGSLFGG